MEVNCHQSLITFRAHIILPSYNNFWSVNF